MRSTLGQSEASTALGLIVRLFPRWKVTPELTALWLARLSSLPVDAQQITAIIGQHRIDAGSRSDPNIKAIIERAHAAREDAVMDRAGAKCNSDKPKPDPNGRYFGSYREWAHWHAANPTDWLDEQSENVVRRVYALAGGGRLTIFGADPMRDEKPERAAKREQSIEHSREVDGW